MVKREKDPRKKYLPEYPLPYDHGGRGSGVGAINGSSYRGSVRAGQKSVLVQNKQEEH